MYHSKEHFEDPKKTNAKKISGFLMVAVGFIVLAGIAFFYLTTSKFSLVNAIFAVVAIVVMILGGSLIAGNF
jgi:small-conductance mechanosensitive channel